MHLNRVVLSTSSQRSWKCEMRRPFRWKIPLKSRVFLRTFPSMQMLWIQRFAGWLGFNQQKNWRKAFWTMFKKTADLVEDGPPYNIMILFVTMIITMIMTTLVMPVRLLRQDLLNIRLFVCDHDIYLLHTGRIYILAHYDDSILWRVKQKELCSGLRGKKRKHWWKWASECRFWSFLLFLKL